MTINHNVPELSKELQKRIKLVRRDVGNLLFHFTRKPSDNLIQMNLRDGSSMTAKSSACAVLMKILQEGRLLGTSKWTYGKNCICFTEAPIQELNSLFSLVEIASLKDERPRYEPYGIAVNKKFLFKRGGRPVIYDHPSAFDELPESLRYRFVKYDPENQIDYTWEREWRIQEDFLQLDPKETLVIVPSSLEAFEIVYSFSNIKADQDIDGSFIGVYHDPKWLVASLDLFGMEL